MNIVIALASLIVAIGGAKSGESRPCEPGVLVPEPQTSPYAQGQPASATLAPQRRDIDRHPIKIVEADYACTLDSDELLDRGNPY